MTKKQFRKKAAIARKFGIAFLGHGAKLYYEKGDSFPWTMLDKNGITVDVAETSEQLEYLFE